MFFELTKSKLTSNNVLKNSHADDKPTDRLVPGDKGKIYLDFMVFGVAFCFNGASVVLTEIAIMMEAVMVSFVQWIERAIQRMNSTKSY